MNLTERLKDWTEVDETQYKLAIQLGLISETVTFPDFGLIIWTENKYIAELNRILENLTTIGLLEFSEDLDKYRANPDFKLKLDDDFKATVIKTVAAWEDLILDEIVREQVMEIITWAAHGEVLVKDWKLAEHIKPYKALFHGRPGTGKKMTAALLGKALGLEVYRIDLSMVVSKYIGETEKNLAVIFDHAAHKHCILFFDEADALFGKRTENSGDRSTNQQTSYLLQRIEDFPGVVILASNLRANLDEAFERRFQSVILFPMPDASMRKRMWENAFGNTFPIDIDDYVDLDEISEKYELSGGAIINVMRMVALTIAERIDKKIHREDIINGIREEFSKEGKAMPD